MQSRKEKAIKKKRHGRYGRFMRHSLEGKSKSSAKTFITFINYLFILWREPRRWGDCPARGIEGRKLRRLRWFRPFYFVDYFYYRTVTSTFSRVRVVVTVPNRME